MDIDKGTYHALEVLQLDWGCIDVEWLDIDVMAVNGTWSTQKC
jgi:hypothetical protein